jgi:hypothetical protein
MRQITITISDEGRIDVREGDRYCDGLCWDEMIGQIAAMTMPTTRINQQSGMLYQMLTKEQWAERDEMMRKSMQQAIDNNPGEIQ